MKLILSERRLRNILNALKTNVIVIREDMLIRNDKYSREELEKLNAQLILSEEEIFIIESILNG